MMGLRAAAVLALCLLGAFLLNLLLVSRDRARREQLETVVESSGVGDHVFLPLPEEPPAGSPIARYEGKVLRAFDGETIKVRDSDMMRVGPDDSQSYTVYRPAADTKEKDVQGFLFLKLGDGEYLKLRQPEP